MIEQIVTEVSKQQNLIAKARRDVPDDLVLAKLEGVLYKAEMLAKDCRQLAERVG